MEHRLYCFHDCCNALAKWEIVVIGLKNICGIAIVSMCLLGALGTGNVAFAQSGELPTASDPEACQNALGEAVKLKLELGKTKEELRICKGEESSPDTESLREAIQKFKAKLDDLGLSR
jgi:hypothetical protein